MANGASLLGAPGPQQVAMDAGTICRALARGSVATSQMTTQVAQLLEGAPEQTNLGRARRRTARAGQDEQAPRVQHCVSKAEQNLWEARLLLAIEQELVFQARLRRNAADDMFAEAEVELAAALATEKETQHAMPVFGNTTAPPCKRKRAAEAAVVEWAAAEAAGELAEAEWSAD